jgi:hypothetical protein
MIAHPHPNLYPGGQAILGTFGQGQEVTGWLVFEQVTNPTAAGERE